MALTGRLDVDFVHEPIVSDDGTEVLLQPPVADELPAKGFDPGKSGFEPPATDPSKVTIVVDPHSTRLELLEPFPPWDGKDLTGLRVLMKAVGKCTTDHISPAGPWLQYRGHLTNISQNLFIGVNNAFVPEGAGEGIDVRDGSEKPLPELAKAYKDAGIGWIAIGDENYGEGSSREHAAMEPRYMNCKGVLVRSFARIHEVNLKKQGVLALTFANPDDYERFEADDDVDIVGLAELAPGKPVRVLVHHANGATDEIETTHTMSEEHIEWFRAGSALNVLRAEGRGRA